VISLCEDYHEFILENLNIARILNNTTADYNAAAEVALFNKHPDSDEFLRSRRAGSFFPSVIG
jgi:hypothetical protein